MTKIKVVSIDSCPSSLPFIIFSELTFYFQASGKTNQNNAIRMILYTHAYDIFNLIFMHSIIIKSAMVYIQYTLSCINSSKFLAIPNYILKAVLKWYLNSLWCVILISICHLIFFFTVKIISYSAVIVA